MPKISFEVEGDTEGHAAKREVDVTRMTMETAEGETLTLEPTEAGEGWRVVSGPDDVVGHAARGSW